jgi:cytokinin dehydrogenase
MSLVRSVAPSLKHVQPVSFRPSMQHFLSGRCVTSAPFRSTTQLSRHIPKFGVNHNDHPRFFSSCVFPNPGHDPVKKVSKLGLCLLGGAMLISIASSSTVDDDKSLALMEDPEFNTIKGFYYDAGQYDWVKENYSTDFGKLVIQPPLGVFKPRSEEHLQKFIELANKHKVKITCRGQGHSTDGQILCENGIVIDLRDLPKQFQFTHPDRKDAFVVSGHATWKELLDVTIQHRKTVPVLTDYLKLSVAGTLSIGGLGGSSFKKGCQADHVLALRILTFDGRILFCSRTENKELFNAALCGSGQVGIILDATLSLVESKEQAHSRLLYYRNSEQFLKDQHLLYSKGEIDHLKGFIQKLNGELYYVIDAAVFYDKPSDVVNSEVFKGLSPEKIVEKDVPYIDFVHEVTHFTEMLSKADKWNVPHPWYGVLLPEDKVAEHLKKALESPFLKGSEPFLLFPLNTEHFKLPSFHRPQGKTMYLLNLLYNCSFDVDPKIDTTKVLEYNKALYSHAAQVGGICYPPKAIRSLQGGERRSSSQNPQLPTPHPALAGALAGFTFDSLSNPLLRARNIMARGGAPECDGMVKTLQYIVRTEGVRGLYRGLLPLAVSSPIGTGVFFATNYQIKKWGPKNDTTEFYAGIIAQFLGAGAGWVPGAVVFETRHMTPAQSPLYPLSTRQIIKHIATTQGFFGFYPAFFTHNVGFSLFNGLGMALSSKMIRLVKNTRQDELRPSELAMVNAFSFGIAGVLTTPIDTSKICYQMDSVASTASKSFFRTLKNMYREGGILRFFDGALPRLLALAPRQAFVVSVFQHYANKKASDST